MSLTANEWHALASAIAERDENLRDRQEAGERRLGVERAALYRAQRKVREALVTDRSWGR